MLITEEVEVKLHSKNIKHYERLGYKIPRRKDKWGKYNIEEGTFITVNVSDLLPYSASMIQCLCDYCLEEGIETIITKQYSEYTKQNKKVHKDCCKKCKTLKYKEVLMITRGVENPMYLQETKEKIKNTNLIRYGVENVYQNKIFQEKSKNTSLQKYGVFYTFQSEIVKENIKLSNLQKYGVESTNSLQEVKDKQRYSLYKNNTAPCSAQQRYLHNLLGGELNYPIGFNVDIAFLNEKIYIEYDGSGHRLSVKFGNMTNKEFNQRQIKRGYVLKRKGWKLIRIISNKDCFPNDEIIINLINQAKEYLNTGHSWFEINIDEGRLKCSQYEKDYDFGKLNKINKI